MPSTVTVGGRRASTYEVGGREFSPQHARPQISFKQYGKHFATHFTAKETEATRVLAYHDTGSEGRKWGENEVMLQILLSILPSG